MPYGTPEYWSEIAYRLTLEREKWKELCAFCGLEREEKRCGPGLCLIWFLQSGDS